MAKAKAKISQEFVPIDEIRDGIVVLKDGSLCLVLMASSLNFALKSEDEQQAIIFQFQNFLNSLDFSVQFHIQSRKLDIRPYLATLEERIGKQTHDLMKIQIKEYIGFIKNFTETTSIMTKSFFVVIPYQPAILTGKKSKGLLSGLFGRQSKQEASALEKRTFEENRTQIEQRANVVEQGLSRTGVRTIPLGTEELVELYYKIFNPGELEKPIANR
ncbi:MAG: hypothetical protein COV10_03860 [Candidatus Vogelbacteria bacterium CG10_big_fil_rev_8_21_14_0_10_51_16]|uniref:TraC-like domain-containing protein n=1 Tax=Candidatus Vogelbacteria bacterium CG10_big_fil_rev_8_21_14_0_10_51_16 TaxID=1975045 RepID=A0A2H0RDI4_9BACT|nr:MAG: hypothetical protein COV10_03860 [Candidatus Vogelbacteria bacterium CG10_big_fil_rev_8_21_14_0_10_51_16]